MGGKEHPVIKKLQSVYDSKDKTEKFGKKCSDKIKKLEPKEYPYSEASLLLPAFPPRHGIHQVSFEAVASYGA